MAKNIPIDYTRQPAKPLVLEKRLGLMVEFNAALLQIITKHLPGLGQETAQLHQSFLQGMSQLDSVEGELVLAGHGLRGSNHSLAIDSKSDADNFLKRAHKPAEDPLSTYTLVNRLENYLAIDTGQNGRVWVAPDETMYGNRWFPDATDVTRTKQVMGIEDGLYPIPGPNGEKAGSYMLVLHIDEENILMFSPTSGPSFVTYSALEERWIQHTAHRFMDGTKVLEKVEAFFANTNVHDVSERELARLWTDLKRSPDLLDSKRGLLDNFDFIETRADGLRIKLGSLFVIDLSTTEQKIVSLRDDYLWTDLTEYTRRHLFRDLLKRCQLGAPTAAKTDSKPFVAPKRQATKKVAKGKKK